MSKAIYELTAKTIDLGYREKDENLIEKETDYLLGKIVTLMLSMFSDKIKGITFDKNGIRFDSKYLLSEKHKKNLLKWANRLIQMELPSSDIEFGKLKIDFEKWYYQLGGEEISFEYQESYLLTPKEASEQLGISRVTLNKYIQNGLESVDTTSHRKIPKYVIELWKDPVYAIRMQMIAQEKKLRNQTPAERLEEINNELTQLQIKYKSSSFQEAFREYDGDSMDNPSDYYLWRDLENEKREIIQLLGGN
ncbi:hypothetical protein CU633_22070 [Bacillus sp. V3-13]|uniref:helix-turn-helix domain-containing protein n=1 Tax=Bacillus sp. V3-13 TaxID=2053728 RepID=UPI000C77E7AC|nr:helix-turn-helix domain-containing protein [Bacillus sp. V3-13]PLR75268.1 hypothetical protein CU633_22070 [Bacillus sp. V3-13]